MQVDQGGAVSSGYGGNDVIQRKRVRAGSISGRLRTASDLEEIGMIDKYQKGYIKDLIISGDPTFQTVLEKYEKGDKKELEDLIKSGYLGRKQSIDILDDLDFEFLDGIKNDLDGPDAFGDDGFGFDFGVDPNAAYNPSASGGAHGGPAVTTTAPAAGHNKPRTSSVDSTGSFSFFENLPYDANNANSLMEELQYLNRQYGDTPTGDLLSGFGNKPGSPRMRSTDSAGSGKGMSVGAGNTAGAPHVSFSKYVSAIGGVDGDAGGTLSGHKGRRDSWDIAAQYIQQEEDLHRGNGSVNAGQRMGLSAWQQQQLQAQRNLQTQQGGAQAATTKSGGGARKPNAKTDGTGGGPKGGAGVNVGGRPSTGGGGGMLYSGGAGGGGSSSGAGAFGAGPGLRGLSTTGGTSTSTQHSAYNTASASYLHSGGGALNTSGTAPGAYDELAGRIGGPGFIGAYSPEQRRQRIEKFIEKRGRRVWTKKVKYDVRKNFADSRLRVKGRFVKKEDEDIMREILSI